MNMEYKTKDFYLSVCLLASGIRPRLQKINHKTYLFIFSNENGQAEELIEKHWNRKLLIPSRDLIDAVAELKTRIYEGN